MALHTVLLYLLASVNLITMIHLGLYIVGANTYDVAHFRKEHSKRRNSSSLLSQAKNPLVSIVIPAHNEALCIRRTLDSVLASTYQNIEVVVVDDGSTDETRAIVRNYIGGVSRNDAKTY